MGNLTAAQRRRIDSFLDRGLSSQDIADRVGVSVQTVAALRAWRTMNANQGETLSNSNSKNLRYFRVQGEFVVRATSQSAAIEATQRARVPGTTVLSSNVDVERISSNEAASLSES